jgi:hypothetical protein
VKKLVKKEKEPKNKLEIKYPLSEKINAYGFLHFRKSLLSDLGWTKDMAVTLDRNSDGSVTIRKAQKNA